MFKPASLYIGLRYFFASSGNRLVSFISGLAVTGLVLGVALLVVVLSIMNGFEQELRTRILGLVPHVRLFQQGGVQDWQRVAKQVKELPGVTSATPFTRVAGMLTYRGAVQPVSLHGERLQPGQGNHRLHEYLNWKDAEGVRRPLFLAAGVAEKLGVEAGSRLQLIVPATGEVQNSKRAQYATFTVVGVFDTGTELDQQLAITRLSVASKLAGFNGAVEGLQIHVDDIFAVRDLRHALRYELPFDFYSRDWAGSHGNLYQAINMSRDMVLLLIFVIVAIAAFNVVSMLVMTVSDKRSAIAILKTLGYSEVDILKIFITKGSLIGLMGCLIGAVLGVVSAGHVGAWVSGLEQLMGLKFLNTEVYPVDQLPSLLLWTDVAVVVIAAFVLNMIATIYPAWKAARIRPADELRYE